MKSQIHFIDYNTSSKYFYLFIPKFLIPFDLIITINEQGHSTLFSNSTGKIKHHRSLIGGKMEDNLFLFT